MGNFTKKASISITNILNLNTKVLLDLKLGLILYFINVKIITNKGNDANKV